MHTRSSIIAKSVDANGAKASSQRSGPSAVCTHGAAFALQALAVQSGDPVHADGSESTEPNNWQTRGISRRNLKHVVVPIPQVVLIVSGY